MLRILRHLNKKQLVFIAFAIALIVVQVGLNLKMPDYMAAITTLVETPGSAMQDIFIQGGWMLACAFGAMACMMAVGYLVAQAATGLARTLRGQVFSHALSLSKGEADQFGAASLVNRCTNDITQIQTVVTMGLMAVVQAPVMAVWAIVKIVGYGWQWSLATAGAAAVLMCMLLFIFMYAVPRFRRIQKLSDNINLLMREHLVGIRPVRAYNAEAFEQDRFEGANNALTTNNLQAFRVMAVVAPMMAFITSVLTLAIYWIGAYLVGDAMGVDRLTLFSEMVVFSNYAMQVIMAFMLLNMVFIMYPRAQVSANRIMQVIETKSDVTDGPGVVEDSVMVPTPDTEGVKVAANAEDVRGGESEVDAIRGGSVEFRNVSFAYPDGTSVLHDISFSVSPGQRVAFIGSTGSGKTTLVQLVERLYDATEGQVLIDGHDAREYKLSQLRNKIGYVPQTATLFSGTVASNVLYGVTDDITRAKRAVSIAQADEFVSSKPEGLFSPIDQGGRNVSGGQRQRLAIARAIARKPEILVFDDSFSALDFATDRALRSALERECGNSTQLVVAQRVSTIRDADQIVVLDDGRAVGVGTHDDLMKTCETYREIVLSQMSEEEAAHATA